MSYPISFSFRVGVTTYRSSLLAFVIVLTVHSLSPIASANEAPEPPPTPKTEESSAYEHPVDYSGGSGIRLGGVFVGAGATFGNGPYWGPGRYGSGPYGFGWYGYFPWMSPLWSPWFASPFGPAFGWPAASWIHPGYWGGFAQSPGAGEVLLRTPHKDDTVMVDGAYAGLAKDLKGFWLEPGVYLIGVAAENGDSFEKKIYVLSGKTLRINATLSPPESGDPEATNAATERKP